MKIKELLLREPTRSLEEVQKVNDYEKVKQDVTEFYATERAKNFLYQITKLIDNPHQQRFIYLHAIFGSGKTHLLKLLGLVIANKDQYRKYRADLFAGIPSFESIYNSMKKADLSYLIPIFLNLLDRDASQEPPLPLIIYKAIGVNLGYPTDPLWLLEWSINLDVKYQIWDELQDYEYNGKKFKNILDEKANLRSWLYETLPQWDKTSKIFNDKEEVRQSIIDAEDKISRNKFDSKCLANVISELQNHFSKKNKKVEFLFGLDEVALFIGNDIRRYEELRAMIKTLREGPNPIIIGTGQWPLSFFEKNFFGKEEVNWCNREMKLASTDAEIIARKRWLQKEGKHLSEIKEITEYMDKFKLDINGEVDIVDPSSLEIYPFKKYDLYLLRDIIQRLLTHGKTSDHDHVQGRALLVLVRLMFIEGMGEKEVGNFVSWDLIYDILEENTVYIPTWFQDLIKRLDEVYSSKIPLIVETAKVVYLLNNSSKIPATINNITILLLKNKEENYRNLKQKVKNALGKLSSLHYIYDEEIKGNKFEYRILSQEEMTLAEKIDRQPVSKNELRTKILSWLQENKFLYTEDYRNIVDLEQERRVPLKIRYSILEDIQRPNVTYDAVTIRVLVTDNNVEEYKEKWQDINSKGGYEDLLVAIKLTEGLKARIERSLARKKVLDSETKRYEDLEAIKSRDDLNLKKEIMKITTEGFIFDRSIKQSRGSFGQDFVNEVKSTVKNKFPNRKVLDTPFRQIDDAIKIDEFFFNNGDWPLSENDADMLGINTVTRDIGDGWCGYFLSKYSDKMNVSGEELIKEIEDETGSFLGTPLESLSCLLITLAVSKKITIKWNGHILSEAKDIGKRLRTKEDFLKIIVKMEPPIDPEEQNKIVELYNTIIGKEPNSNIEELMKNLSTWIEEHENIIKKVQADMQHELVNIGDMKELLNLISPAFKGEIISKEKYLTESTEILRQANSFIKAKRLFYDNQVLWNKFKNEGSILFEIYPNRSITDKFRKINSKNVVPNFENIEELIIEAEKMRLQHIKDVYYMLTGKSTSHNNIIDISEVIEKYIEQNYDLLERTIGNIQLALPFVLDFSRIKDFIDKAKSQIELDITEKVLNEKILFKELRNLKLSRELLKENTSGVSIWSSFTESLKVLEQQDPSNEYLKIWEEKDNDELPDMTFFKTVIDLVNNKRNNSSGTKKKQEKNNDDFDDFWNKLILQLKKDDIVLIDCKGER
ncbi:MAG: hypothetical protein ACOCRO_04975 [Halanaerobiales bacterium]